MNVIAARSFLVLAGACLSAALWGCEGKDLAESNAEPSAAEVHFGERKLAAGTALEVGTVISFELSTEARPVQGSDGAVARSEVGFVSELRIREHVLAAERGEPTRMRVRYLKNRTADLERDGSQRESRSPLEGKSFELTRQGDRFAVTGVFGGAVSAEDLRAVADEQAISSFEDEREALTALSGQSITLGADAAGFATALSRIVDFGAGEGSTVADAKAVLVSPPDAEGLVTFDTSMTVTLQTGPAVIRVPLRGQADVSVREGVLRRLSLSGPAEVSASEAVRDAARVTGSGRLRIRVQFRFVE